MAASADFTVNGSVPTGAVAVAASSTVNLALVSTVGVSSISWSVGALDGGPGTSGSAETTPTITPGGSPSGATASFIQPSPTTVEVGCSLIVMCTVVGHDGVTVRKTALIGVAGTSTEQLPLAAGEGPERNSTHFYTEFINERLAVVSATGVSSVFGQTGVVTGGTITGDLDFSGEDATLTLPNHDDEAQSALTPAVGMVLWNTDNERIEVWDGSAWAPVGGGIGSDNIANESNVTGATVSDALDTLDSNKADAADLDDYLPLTGGTLSGHTNTDHDGLDSGLSPSVNTVNQTVADSDTLVVDVPVDSGNIVDLMAVVTASDGTQTYRRSIAATFERRGGAVSKLSGVGRDHAAALLGCTFESSENGTNARFTFTNDSGSSVQATIRVSEAQELIPA